MNETAAEEYSRKAAINRFTIQYTTIISVYYVLAAAAFFKHVELFYFCLLFNLTLSEVAPTPIKLNVLAFLSL